VLAENACHALSRRQPAMVTMKSFAHHRSPTAADHRNVPVNRSFRGQTWRPWLALAAVLILGGAPLPGFANGPQEDNQEITRATLENGLRVVIVRNTLAPVVTTAVNYLVGSNEAPEGFPGMAHAQEHMLFRGSQGLSADQLAAIAAGMGGNFDAQTQQTVTQYLYTVPAQDLDVALEVEATRMGGVLDSEDLWRQERGAIEQEVAQDLSNPEYVFYSRLLEQVFKGTPYAHDALGTRASFDRTTAAMLHKFYDTWYAPNNAILVITGAVQPERVLTQVKALFESIPSKKLPDRPAVKLQPLKPVTLHQATDLSYGMVTISMRMPGFDNQDYAAAQVLGDVLNSQRAALSELVARGEALDAEFDQSTLPQAGIGTAALAFPAGDNPDPLLKKLRRIISEYAKEGVPAELVEAAKRRERAAVELRKNSVSGLATVWSQALALEGRDSPQEDIDAIEQVSVADVNRVARSYLDVNHAVTGILTPSASENPASAKGFGGEESFTSSHVKPVELPRWAADKLTRLALPESTVRPIVSTLPNGLRLIVQPESVSNTISLYGRIKSNPDVEAPRGQEGVDEVLDGLFSFGTTHLDRLDFQKALDDIGVDIDTGTSFSTQALNDDFEDAVKLLADNELNPALPRAAFEIVKAQVAASQKGVLQSPDYLTDHALTQALFPATDPSLRQATPKTVNALSLDDVRRYYARVFRPDLTTVVVIGNVTPQGARAVVEKYFGQWQAEGPKPDTLLPVAPPNKASVTRVPDSSQVQNQVILAQTLGLNRFHPDYYALELGNQILSGGFYASRLYRDLREETGLVYYVDSSLDVGETRGVYSVRYASDPTNVPRARAMVLRDLRVMQTMPVNAAELHQAKALLLRQIPLSAASVDDIANHLLSVAEIGLPLDESTRAARHYLEMTVEQVQSAYKNWLRPDDMAEVIQGPTPLP
jgi:zinc protease